MVVSNVWSGSDYERPVVRCAFCFQPKDGRKMIKRHFTNDYVNLHVEVCDTRCGDLWQAEVRREYEKIFAYAHNA